jgi:hypothetical protein
LTEFLNDLRNINIIYKKNRFYNSIFYYINIEKLFNISKIIYIISFMKNIDNFFYIFFILFIIEYLNIVYIKDHENLINRININIGLFRVRF